MNVFIVEDEILHLEDIKISVEAAGYQCVGHTDDAFEALEMLKELSVSVALVDIHLNGKLSGIKLAHKIKEEFNIPVIFVTSEKSVRLIEDAIAIDPVAYLVKPINDTQLKAAMLQAARLEARLEARQESLQVKPARAADLKDKEQIYIKSGNKLIKVVKSQILFIQTDTKNYCSVVTTENKKYTFRDSILSFYQTLNSTEFLQVHRSYIVNIKFVDFFHEKEQMLEVQNHQIPVGRTFKQELYERIHIV